MTDQDNPSDSTFISGSLAAGARLGRYRLAQRIGAGGMGEVYLAEDTELHRTVAIKLLPPSRCQNPESRARFKREAQAAAKLSDPHIVTIFEVNDSTDRPFIAMEFVEGRTLKDMIAAHDLTLDNIVVLSLQICAGLRKAHQAGVVHRDIKPANILINHEGQAKIVDFGLASLDDGSSLTQSGAMMGTVSYMSPEQMRGDKIDIRTDIWSFGVILYEMIAGHVPFGGEYYQAIMYAVMTAETPPLAASGTTSGRTMFELERIIRRCLAKNPDARYRDTSDLLQDLKTVQGASTGDSVPPRRQVPSIAVLPFRDMSPEGDQAFFCEGIAEELINALTQVEGLKVAARSSAFQYGTQGIDIRRLGLELGVDAVLEGSVRKAGNRLRITAQLIQVSDGYHLWSERYDRELEDIFAIQDEISLAIVHRLRVKLLKDEGAKLVKKFTGSEQAYVLYLKGRYCWNRRYEGSMQLAVEFFQQAVAADPSYALSYVGLADCYCQYGLYAMADPRVVFPKAKEMLDMASAIDDRIPEAHASAGYIKMFYDWDWVGADASFQRALALNPNCAVAHAWYSLLLGILNRHEQGMHEGHRALELEPLGLIYHAVLGLGYYWLREYDTAIERLRRTLEMDPNFPLAHLFFGFSLCVKEQWDEAILEFEKSSLLSADSPICMGYTGYAHGAAGRPDEARAALARLNELSGRRYVPSLYKGLVHYGLGDHEAAINFLEQAFDEREAWMATLNTFPLLDGLRQNPRFQALVQRIGFPA